MKKEKHKVKVVHLVCLKRWHLKRTDESRWFVLFYSRANNYLVDGVGLLFLLVLMAMLV
jgi:hypothetical protein